MLVAEVCEVNKPEEEQKIESRMDLTTVTEEALMMDVGAISEQNHDMNAGPVVVVVVESEDILVVLVKEYTVLNFVADNA